MDLTALSLLFELGAAVLWLAFRLRHHQRRKYDHMRRTYTMHFPHELPHDAVLNFFRGLSGLPTPKFWRPIHSVVVEIYGDVNGITFLLSIPNHHVRDGWVESLFRTHIVGGSLVKADFEMPSWDQVAEYKVPNKSKVLRISDPAAVVATILSGFSPLTADQAVMLQYPISPARYRVPTPETQEKLSEPNFLAVCRVAALGPDADNLMHRMYNALASLHTHEVKFIPRMVPAQGIADRIWRRSGMLVYPSVFNARELAVLLCFPFGSPNVPGLPQGRTRHLAPDYSIPQDGVVIGSSTFPGMEDRRLALPLSAFLTHTWIMGKTGTGKSTLLENMMYSIMRQPERPSIVIMGPKSELTRHGVAYVPPDRFGDVIYFDPTDTKRPMGFNPLAGSDPERISSNHTALFRKLFAESWGPRLEYILRELLYTGAAMGLTYVDLTYMLIEPSYRQRVLRSTTNRRVSEFWGRYSGDKHDVEFDSVLNKLAAFTRSDYMRPILGQTSGLNMGDVVNNHKILFVPLPSSIGKLNASILGSLVFYELWGEVRLRDGDVSCPVIAIIDEWQNYAGEQVALEEILAEGRGHGLGIIGANQELNQLPKRMQSAVKANARTRIMFEISHSDAKDIAQEMPSITPADLQNLAQREVIAQLMTETGPAPVATARTMPPPRPISSGEALIEASKRVYGRDFKDVENELARRHYAGGAERKNPIIGRIEE